MIIKVRWEVMSFSTNNIAIISADTFAVLIYIEGQDNTKWKRPDIFM